MKKVVVALLFSFIGLALHAQTSIYDINNDGRVTIKDLAMATNYLNGHINYPVTSVKVAEKYAAIDLQVGKSQTIRPTLTPTDADLLTCSYESTDTSVCTISSTGVIKGIGLGRAKIIYRASDNCGAQATIDVMVYDKDVDDYEYVDLGLPSGILWATCNLGATSPEEAGGYFSWGETVPMGEPDSTNLRNIAYTGGSNVKTICLAANYKYYLGQMTKVTKYCTRRTYWAGEGEMDSTYTLLKVDNAARNIRGANWTMPTTINFAELRNDTNCVWTWCDGDSVKYNNLSVPGYLVTSLHNGNTLFFPAKGYYKDTGRNNYHKYGYYWTRTLNVSDPQRAYTIYMTSTSRAANSWARYCGMNIRPVRVQKASALTTTN